MFATALAAVGFFQSAARPDGRGVAHEVRLPLRRRPRTGAGCAGSSGRCCCSRWSAACSRRRCSSPSPRSPTRSSTRTGSEPALLAAALLPLVQSTENVGATALLLHSRYDLRGAYQAGSAGLRLVAIAIGAQYGVTEALAAMVVAQGVCDRRHLARRRRRAPPLPARAPRASSGEDVPGIRSFVLQSSIATGVISLRTTLVPVILGVVAGPTQVGLFRIAQTPQTGLAAASSPARLVLLTEQTRDWERGRAGERPRRDPRSTRSGPGR